MEKINRIAGVDEVGRGCLSGPVFSSAVIFKKNIKKSIIKDSKKISYKNRIFLSKYIKKNSVFAIGSASVKEIEKLNILNASLLSMKRALNKLKKKPSVIYIDGIFAPKNLKIRHRTFIKGDQRYVSIAAASIVAKAARDEFMIRLGRYFPKYKWNKNFGYGTAEHLESLKKYGITKHHRKNFGPIHNILIRQTRETQ